MPDWALLHLPNWAAWQWALGVFSAFMIGVAKTGAPGVGTLIAPLMVVTVGDARLATAWALPVLVTADVSAVWYWRRKAEARRLIKLAPWVFAGLIAGALALGLDELIIRRMTGVIVLAMLLLYMRRRFSPPTPVHGNPAFYGVVAGFASTVANAAGPVMSLYLLAQDLPKDVFVATGVWFFLALNIAKAPVYAIHGLYSRESLTFDVMMMPAVLAGAMTGRWLIHHIPQRLFEFLVIALTALSCFLLFR